MCSGVKVAVGLQVLVWPSASQGETECHDVEAPSRTACVPAMLMKWKKRKRVKVKITFYAHSLKSKSPFMFNLLQPFKRTFTCP